MNAVSIWKKIRLPLLTILFVLIIDQTIKIWIKSSFPLEHHIPNVPLGEPNNNKIELLFIENPGMAFGVEFGGDYGKLALSLFRILAAIFGVFYIRHIVRQREHWGYIFSVSLIFAGAVGNIIDCAFYGLIFSESTFNSVAQLFPPEGGYAGFLHGKVVDMFHVPFWHGRFPEWFPFWGGESFEFFSPIFNFADASISVGVGLIFIFQRIFFKKPNENNDAEKINSSDSNKELNNSDIDSKSISSENSSN
ncbi:MAG: lipoprotein signal peptidase [Bacteroidota bacterium]|jgi:signal peptidase II